MMASLTVGEAMAEGAFDTTLTLDPARFAVVNVIVDGKPMVLGL